MKRIRKIDAKPCPFCGNENINALFSITDDFAFWVWVECSTCGARSKAFVINNRSENYKLSFAINNWDRRAGE